MINFDSFHFLHPQWLWGLIPIALLLLLLLRRAKINNTWSAICAPHLLPHLLSQRGQSSYHRNLFLLACGWFVAIMALAGPAWQQLPQPIFQKQTARVIIFDLSPGMLSDDIQPSRLVRARYKLNDILQQAVEGQTALIVFSGEPYLVSPFTEDTRTIMSMVDELTPQIMPLAGNDIASALNMAQEVLQQNNLTQGDIILLTGSSPNDKALEAAEQLAKLNYKVSVLGIGTTKGTPIKTASGDFLKDQYGAIIITQLDKSGLAQLAKKGNGYYANFEQNDHDVVNLMAKLQAHLQSENKSENFTIMRWQDEGHKLALLLLPLAVYGFRRGKFAGIVR